MFASQRNPISLDEPFSAIEPEAVPMTKSVNLGEVTRPETNAQLHHGRKLVRVMDLSSLMKGNFRYRDALQRLTVSIDQ